MAHSLSERWCLSTSPVRFLEHKRIESHEQLATHCAHGLAVHLSYEGSVLLRFTGTGYEVQSLLLKIGPQLVRGVGHPQPHVVQMLYGDQVIVWACLSYCNFVEVIHRGS